MTIEITWTITAIIAVSSFLSPIFVAKINNKHQEKMRKLELEHDEYMRQLDLQQQMAVKQLDIYYSDKKTAFANFLHDAGVYSMRKGYSSDYEALQSSLQTALLFCDEDSKLLLTTFLEYANKIFGSNYSSYEKEEYSKTLSAVTNALNKELNLTKPVIDCKKCK